ncbi:hypothetical protein AB0L24_38010, partial [Streptomyces achromogenes]
PSHPPRPPLGRTPSPRPLRPRTPSLRPPPGPAVLPLCCAAAVLALVTYALLLLGRPARHV